MAMVIFFSSLGNNGGSSDGPRSGNIFDAIFPFGNSSDNQGGGGSTSEDTDPIVDTRPVPRLRMISEKPTSGGAPFLFSEDEEERIAINYMERETGHLYETFSDGLTVRRISNTTIPGVQEILWINRDEAIIRLFSGGEIEHFYLQLPTATTTQSVTGVFLGVWDYVSLDTNGSTLVTVSATDEGGSTVTSIPPNGGTERTIFTSALRSWVPLQTQTSVFIQTTPASNLQGFLYRISNGNLVKILGGISGLMANPNPSGELILYSAGRQNFSFLEVLNTQTGETTGVPFSSIATKCVWLPPENVSVLCGVPNSYQQGNYPEDWLQGKVSFADTLWLFDTTSGETKELLHIADEYGVAIDVWQPRVSEDGSYLTFINKNDLSFWGFQITE